MGIFKKKNHNITEEEIIRTEEVPVKDEVVDDFDEIDFPTPEITREEFHKMAEESLQNAIDEGTVQVSDVKDTIPAEEVETDTSDNAEPETPEQEEQTIEAEDTIDAVADTDTETQNEEDFEISEKDDDIIETVQTDTDTEPEKEKKVHMTFAQLREKHKKALKISGITVAVIFVACLALYIYGCATVPKNVMGRNIYIEKVNVSGLTYDEALEKVKTTSLLTNCNITVLCKGETYTINGLEIGLTPRIEDTVDKAMRYGKTGNILIDGFANALQVIARHTVMPSANVSEEILRGKLAEFGNIIYGELVEHKLEIGDEKLICTPGHSGFSGNTDKAYEQVIKAIETDDFSRIKVTLKSASPKNLTVKDIDAFTYTDPKDARYEITDNSVTVVPEVWGRHLDLKAIRPLVSQIREGGDVVYIPFKTSEPAVKEAELKEKLFNATLGSFSTYYGGSTANRAANVANAASKINEKVLAPGEVFSFNDTVGKRSTANGFYTAPEYANGQTVMGIGGGTCQVSSTLYNAVLYADLSIVYRLNHMFTVSYCPVGQDATVSDSGVDFKFANNTDYPIKISAVTSGGKITVSILGTQRDVPHTVKIENFSSYSGGNRSVRSYRSVFDPDGNLIRKEELPKSYYMSHDTATEQTTPSQPVQPQTPVQSQAPEQTPTQPSVPEQPVTPVQPTVPEQPATPVQPTVPEQVQTQ